MSNVSRSQISMQAMKTHMKESGSSAAISLFEGNRAITIVVAHYSVCYLSEGSVAVDISGFTFSADSPG